MDRADAIFCVRQVKAVWAIEKMELNERAEQVGIAYLLGELSEEEFENRYWDAVGTARYVVKSEEEQAEDRLGLSLFRRISLTDYFEQLQLSNKLEGVGTYRDVVEADRVFSLKRGMQWLKERKKAEFSLESFLNTHAYLFQDLYYFAGVLRDVPMEIDSVTRFTMPRRLRIDLTAFFDRLKEDKYLVGLSKDKFISKLADYLTDINILHPFREGNGRTKRLFFGALAERAGWKLDWGAVSHEEWLTADECAFDSSHDKSRDTSYLRILLDRAIVVDNDAKA